MLSPVRRVSQVARGVLGRLTDSLLFLAGGWLTVQALRFLEFTSSGNIEALKKLKDRFLKDLLIIGGIVLSLTLGISKVFALIKGLTVLLLKVTFGGLLTDGFKF